MSRRTCNPVACKAPAKWGGRTEKSLAGIKWDGRKWEMRWDRLDRGVWDLILVGGRESW